MNDPSGPLKGLRVFDLTRVLAGPTCAQMLGDLGADVVKIETPGRRRRHPRLRAADDAGHHGERLFRRREPQQALGHARHRPPEGQAIALELIAQSDILVENFKVGALDKYGLGYDQLHARFPRLIYCSITGFGQTGPYAPRPGYDSLIQAMGGVMSLTGEPDGLPQKVGVPVADLFSGLYGCIGILAALRHRDATGQGQQIDIGMLDTHVAWLANQGMNYLATGENPERLGNQHPNIVPYQVFPTADGYIVLSIANDPTFKRFCESFALTHLLEDPRFATNAERVQQPPARHRHAGPGPAWQHRPPGGWSGWRRKRSAAARSTRLSEVFADPQVRARGMVVEMAHGAGVPVKVIANPVRLSETPADYRLAPPLLGEHTEEVLRGRLGMDPAAIAALREKGVV